MQRSQTHASQIFGSLERRFFLVERDLLSRRTRGRSRREIGLEIYREHRTEETNVPGDNDRALDGSCSNSMADRRFPWYFRFSTAPNRLTSRFFHRIGYSIVVQPRKRRSESFASFRAGCYRKRSLCSKLPSTVIVVRRPCPLEPRVKSTVVASYRSARARTRYDSERRALSMELREFSVFLFFLFFRNPFTRAPWNFAHLFARISRERAFFFQFVTSIYRRNTLTSFDGNKK